MTVIMVIPMDERHLYRLMTWLSPSYPVGAYSYSHGLEWVVETGGVSDAHSLRGWVEDILRFGSGWSDGVVFANAFRAAGDEDGSALAEVAELAAAFQPTAERRLEACAQGRAFLDTTQRVWPCGALGLLSRAWDGPVTHAVAVAVACAGHGVAFAPALEAYLHAFAANLVSAGVRLVPLGQTDGQRVTAALEPAITGLVPAIGSVRIEDLGGVAVLADIASARHETQYTRLFRS